MFSLIFLDYDDVRHPTPASITAAFFQNVRLLQGLWKAKNLCTPGGVEVSCNETQKFRWGKTGCPTRKFRRKFGINHGIFIWGIGKL